MPRRALVTGVSGGVGSATAELLHETGWEVLGIDVSEPGEHVALEEFEICDLADADAAATAVERLAGDALDLLVNNAATQPPAGLLEEVPRTWDETFAVNVRAAYVAIRAAAPAIRRRAGAVVNVSSVHAMATSSGRAAYVASKGALVALTRSAALELAPEVRVNAVLPGALRTAMLKEGLAAANRTLDDIAARTPLGRIGTPEEISEAIAFLGDRRRSSYVTGQTLVVDGGVLARLASE